MKLITLEDEMPIFSSEARTIIEFNRILMRDEDRKKKFALKELAFVYFYCSYDNRFELYDTENDRVEAIKASVDLPKDWVIDSIIQDAIKKYSYMMETESMGLVNETRKAIKKLKQFIENVDLESTTKSGSLIFSPKDLQAVIKDMPFMIESLNKAKSIVDKEQEDKLGKGKKQRSLAETSFSKMNEDFRV
jgi:hypothetical protein